MPELTPKLGIKKPLGNETVSRAAFNENWDIIDQKAVGDMGGVPTIQAGPDASKPAAGTAGRLYIATDTKIIYQDTGTAWEKRGVVNWGDIDGKPASFTPSAHKTTHATGGADALAPGDIGAASAADLAAHLADNAIDAHAIIPAARVYHSVNQSIANATEVVLVFDSERFDTDNIHDQATNNSRLTCKTAGKYLIIGSVSWDVNSTGRRQLNLRLNGTTNIAINCVVAVSTSNTRQSVVAIHDMAINDYVELIAVQDSGGALSIFSNAEFSPEFMMVKVG